MTTVQPPRSAPGRPWRRAEGRARSAQLVALGEALVAVVVVSLLLGGLTSLAQGFLPDPVRPFANSASGWTVLTALTVWLTRERTRTSAVLGGASFVALVLGYTIVSQLRGLYYDPVLFGVVGVLVGPLVGVAASWLRRTGWRAALGAAALSGVALGECVYGLVVVSGTTGWFYWALIGAVGVTLLVVTLARRAARRDTVVGGVTVALAVGATFFVAYSALGRGI